MKTFKNAVIIYYDLSEYRKKALGNLLETWLLLKMCTFLINKCAFMKTTVNAILLQMFPIPFLQKGAQATFFVQKEFYYCQSSDL